MRYLSVFSPNAGKYGPEITTSLDIFRAAKNKSSKEVFLRIKARNYNKEKRRINDCENKEHRFLAC